MDSSDEIIEYLSNKYKLPKYAIKQIIEAPFRYMSASFHKREMKSFILPRLGKFVIHPKKKKWIEDNLLQEILKRDELRSKGNTTGMDQSNPGLLQPPGPNNQEQGNKQAGEL